MCIAIDEEKLRKQQNDLTFLPRLSVWVAPLFAEYSPCKKKHKSEKEKKKYIGGNVWMRKV